ncbi:MAG: alpha/beta fold hydrolase [Capnocytophaga sp.]|nr:alpha/beta fold hydrolase [Capnocytophaga sp.]
MEEILSYEIDNYKTSFGVYIPKVYVYYQVFGCPLGEAPVVVINHAFTGNSFVAGEKGWWGQAVGEEKVIDTKKYTILCFNIPGNGYGSAELNILHNYQHWAAVDIAQIFNQTITEHFGLEKVFALVGCSLGGGIAWEMVVQEPRLFEHLVAISADWKSTDWIIGNCLLQEQILNNSTHPLHDARLHAMLCYRSPQSLKMKFERTTNTSQQLYNVESWLLHHGEKLHKRFTLSAYKLMNQLVKTIDISKGKESFEEAVQPIESHITIIGTDSDLYFVPQENRETAEELKRIGKSVDYYEIHSVHGHDAFLIEHQQLEEFLKNIFQ